MCIVSTIFIYNSTHPFLTIVDFVMSRKHKQVRNILPPSPPDKNKNRGVQHETNGLIQDHMRRHDALPCMEWVADAMDHMNQVVSRSKVHPLLPKLISSWGEHCPKGQWDIKMQGLLQRIKDVRSYSLRHGESVGVIHTFRFQVWSTLQCEQ